jgi:hypothetical protein
VPEIQRKYGQGSEKKREKKKKQRKRKKKKKKKKIKNEASQPLREDHYQRLQIAWCCTCAPCNSSRQL